MGLYIVANVDGRVISSTNGTNWTAPFNTGISIGKVAIGPNKIVYSAESGEGGSYTGLYHTAAWNQKVNFQCSSLSEAWVAAVTVCRQRLF
jgi:hypothetical protein